MSYILVLNGSVGRKFNDDLRIIVFKAVMIGDGVELVSSGILFGLNIFQK